MSTKICCYEHHGKGLVRYVERPATHMYGPRLPEGATALPEGAAIKWYLVRIG